MGSRHDPRTILLTGASSGLGAALAEHWSAPGRHLFLAGRSPDRLANLARRCTDRGAACETATIDVTERASMADWIAACNTARPLDLVLANAGISAGARKRPGEGVSAGDREVFDVNVTGVVNTVGPALALMRQRPHPGRHGLRGQIALMSSLAAFRAFPDAPAYCASKAAVRFYGEGLRRVYRREAIGISVICPGFVRTPMTDANDFRMPMLMEPGRAAAIIARGLARDRGRIAFPLPLYIGARIAGLLP